MSVVIFDALSSASAPCNVAIPILCLHHSAVGICMFVELTFTKHILHALGAPVDGVLSAGHMNIINVLGCEKVVACLELLVAGRGYETEPSCGISELQ
eukprot:1848016-Pyramimonas_sp.AAC.1